MSSTYVSRLIYDAHTQPAQIIESIEDFKIPPGQTQSSVIPAVFVNDTGIYYLDAIQFVDVHTGGMFSGWVEGISSTQYIKYYPWIASPKYVFVRRIDEDETDSDTEYIICTKSVNILKVLSVIYGIKLPSRFLT